VWLIEAREKQGVSFGFCPAAVLNFLLTAATCFWNSGSLSQPGTRANVIYHTFTETSSKRKSYNA
jgi:hypothetical protein